jgi:homopolymeric O-antigen transport system ATP-binding protein
MSSSERAISIRRVGKKYTIRHDEAAPTTLSEALTRRIRHPFARTAREVFWALRDVTFDVSQGEVLGLIGSNGAGKSTLLKILSRVTEMSEGEVDLHGRVGSLLEVGTGFNQELTGRENVFLNGSILGMTRSEIRAQFDAIVAFAGVERFLDTPVKHYSSGMYVRLAFAVAAHLRSEILIVDEVLAVGDLDFQRKCLGKMRDVATDGRTVLLVSHNMTAITSLCARGIVLRSGEVAFAGDAGEAVAFYSRCEDEALIGDMRARRDRHGTGDIRAVSLALRNRKGDLTRSVDPGEPFEVIVEYDAKIPIADVEVSVDVEQLDGTRIATLYSGFRNERFVVRAGPGAFACRIDGLPLRPDTYSLNVFISARHAIHDFVQRAMTFEIAPVDVFGTGILPQRSQGALLTRYTWNAAELMVAAAGERR